MLKDGLYGETQTAEQCSQRRSVRLEADLPLVRLKADTDVQQENALRACAVHGLWLVEDGQCVSPSAKRRLQLARRQSGLPRDDTAGNSGPFGDVQPSTRQNVHHQVKGWGLFQTPTAEAKQAETGRGET